MAAAIEGALQQVGRQVAEGAALAVAAIHQGIESGMGHGDREPLTGAEVPVARTRVEGNHRHCRKDCLRIHRASFWAKILLSGSLDWDGCVRRNAAV